MAELLVEDAPQYRISMDTLHHYFEVELTIPKHTTSEVTLRLPAWLPGSYMVRDFARHIVTFSAFSDEKPLPYARTDKSTWKIVSDGQPLQIRYRVYALDLSVRTAYLTEEFAFFNPSAVCLEWVEQSKLPCALSFTSVPVGWQIKTGMPKLSEESNSYFAHDYAAFIDYPFLLGSLDVIAFDACGISHELVLTRPNYADQDRLKADLKAICTAQINLFGQQEQNAPFSHYSFLTMVVGDGFGGLEHRNSTALLTSRHTLEPGFGADPSDEYLTFLSLCSHEYFHSWNVKQLRPREFHPYRLEQEQYTEQLWFYEGMTSYYDDWIIYRAGLMSQSAYLHRLSMTLTRALRGKGPQRQSIAESSFLAWTTYYQQNENAGNAIASYYNKGAVVALIADLYIRANTADKTLDDVMRLAYIRFKERGTGLNDLLQCFEEVGGAELRTIIERAVFTTDSVHLETPFARFGVKVVPSCADPFSQQLMPAGAKPPSVTLGASLQEKATGLYVSKVWEDSPAALAGITAGDTIIAIDHIQASRATVYRQLYRLQPGDKSTIHYFRRDLLLESQITWQAPPLDAFRLCVEEPERLIGWLR